MTKLNAEYWDRVARETADCEETPLSNYARHQCVAAFIGALSYGRRPSEYNAQPPLVFLKTDLWTEGVMIVREVLSYALHQAWARQYFTSYWTTHSIDISGKTCRLAMDNGAPGSITQASIQFLPYKPNTFDAILDPSTIDHVPYPDAVRVMAEYHRCLRLNGTLALIFAHRGGTLTKGQGKDYYTFSVKQVRTDLERLGMEVKKEFAIHGLTTMPLHVLAMLARKLNREQLLVNAFIVLEYSFLSRYLLSRFCPLYVIIARKR